MVNGEYDGNWAMRHWNCLYFNLISVARQPLVPALSGQENTNSIFTHPTQGGGVKIMCAMLKIPTNFFP